MAWTGQLSKQPPWCFIHIPKTSGGWITRALGGAKRDGPAHGLPTRWDYPLIFTCVREPADWLRSAWGNRKMENWNPYPRQVPWQDFCSQTREFKNTDFNQFARNLMAKRPGIIEWLFDCYRPPGVVVVRYGEDLYQFIRDLGGHPDTTRPHNVSSTHGYEIMPETRAIIYEAEKSLYEKYGWREDGSYD